MECVTECIFIILDSYWKMMEFALKLSPLRVELINSYFKSLIIKEKSTLLLKPIISIRNDLRVAEPQFLTDKHF